MQLFVGTGILMWRLVKNTSHYFRLAGLMKENTLYNKKARNMNTNNAF